LQCVGTEIVKGENIDVYYGYIRILIQDDAELNVYRYNYENYLANFNSQYFAAAQHPTCFISSALYKKIGVYNLKYKVAADYDFLIRAKLSKAKFQALDAVITNFRNIGVSNKIDDFTRISQRYEIHYDNNLISDEEYAYVIKLKKYHIWKKFKSKIFGWI
jgi:hypothetical protein